MIVDNILSECARTEAERERDWTVWKYEAMYDFGKWQCINIYWKYRWEHLIFPNWLFSNFQRINVSIKCCIFADVCIENKLKIIHSLSLSLAHSFLGLFLYLSIVSIFVRCKYIWNWLGARALPIVTVKWILSIYLPAHISSCTLIFAGECISWTEFQCSLYGRRWERSFM